MADFCRQCSEELFGKYYGDVSGLITKEQVSEGFVAIVLCEGCGQIAVDEEGNRVWSFTEVEGAATPPPNTEELPGTSQANGEKDRASTSMES